MRNKTFAVMVLVLAAALPASAVSSLRLTSGSSVVVVGDGGSGTISYDSLVGSFWRVNITAGVSGTTALPYLDISTIGTSSSSPSSPPNLHIEFSSTDFGPVNVSSIFNTSIEGRTQGWLRFTSWMDTSNSLFGHGTQLFDLGPFAGGSFSADGTTTAGVAAAAYSMTMDFEVHHPAGSGRNAKTSNFLASLTDPPSVPDGGNTVILLGMGLGVLGWFGRTRMFAQDA